MVSSLCSPVSAEAPGDDDTIAFYEGDLPPPGTRSLFDRLVVSKGPVPFPFADLLALLGSYSNDKAPLVTLMVPDGRSLVRAKGDFKHPRILAAMRGQPRQDSGVPVLRSRLFIGYVEQADQIEVVSYNDAAGRFEFQLVDNYRAGEQPQVRYAPRGLCQTCHQDGSALFSVRPWAETNANPAVAKQIAAARDVAVDARYQGLPIKQSLQQAQRFDALTDHASYLLTSQRAWMEGCGGGDAGRDCRRLMLKAVLRYAMSPARFDRQGAEARALMAAQRGVWPQYGIPLPDVNIASRDPFAVVRSEPLLKRIKGWFAPAPDQAISAVAPLPPELNPITRRPDRRALAADSLEAVFGLESVFAKADISRLREQAGGDAERLLAAVDAPRLDAELGGGPLVRDNIMAALLDTLGGQPPAVDCCSDASVPGEPQLTGVAALALAADSPLLPFQRYCFGCHRGSPIPALNFLGAATEPQLLEDLNGVREAIANTLDWDSAERPMPPTGSRQWRQLQQAINAGEQPLQQLQQALARSGGERRIGMRWPLIAAGGLIVSAVLVYLLLALLNLARRTRWQRRAEALQQREFEQQLALASARVAAAEPGAAASWTGNRRFEITRRVEEVEGVVSLCLTPMDGRPPGAFTGGQYLTLELHPPGSERPLVRCYSLSNGAQQGCYRITVKRELPPRDQPDAPAGLASSWLTAAQPGALVEVRAPAGRFVVPADDERALVFIVGGIGITPVLSILEGLARQQSERDIRLFYAVRDGGRHLFRQRLQELATLLPGLQMQVSYSRPRTQDRAGQDYDQAGRIDIERVRAALPSSNYRFYLCGPAAMTESLVAALLDWQVPRGDILYEAYHAMNVDLSRADRLQLAGVQARVRFARSGQEIDWDPQAENLLVLAEAHGIDIDSGCRAGNCGSCRVGIKSGEVSYVGHHDVEPEQGSCLACVTVPRSDLVLDV